MIKPDKRQKSHNPKKYQQRVYYKFIKIYKPIIKPKQNQTDNKIYDFFCKLKTSPSLVEIDFRKKK